jgi:hypothetical protein
LKRRYSILIILFACLTSEAQSVKRPFKIEAKAYTGLNLPFYEAINYLVKDNIYGADLAVVFPTYGKDYWEKLYRYPRTGAGLSYWSLGNDEVFGRAYALYTFINIPVTKQSSLLTVNYQISFGAAYLTKCFDAFNNHLDRAIGSHTNIYIHLGVDGKIRILPKYELVFEAGATHFSNGKTRSPNYGINIGSFSLGLNHQFGNLPNERADPEIPALDNKYIQSVIYSAGTKVYDNLNGKKYFFSSVSYNVERFVNHKGKAGIGADLFYDRSISEALAAEDGTPENDISKLIRFGVHGSYAMQYKKVSLGLQAGYYLYSKYTDLTRLYDRISIQYHLTSHVLLTTSIKSHYGKADFLEWGIGYTW